MMDYAKKERTKEEGAFTVIVWVAVVAGLIYFCLDKSLEILTC